MNPGTPAGRALFFAEPVPYRTAVELQKRLHEARLQDRIGDTVLFLQHPPVVTIGTRGREDSLLLPRAAYAERGIELVRAGRGGDVTYHGPGQWVMYPVIKLGGRPQDSRGYLANLEQIAIDTAGAFGVEAFRVPGKNGAWTAAGKLAAIGFRVRRWVTMHGMSLNVSVDLEGFRTIIPCGLTDPVVSLQALLGEAAPSLSAVRDVLRERFEQQCGRALAVEHVPPGPLDNPATLVEGPAG